MELEKDVFVKNASFSILHLLLLQVADRRRPFSTFFNQKTPKSASNGLNQQIQNDGELKIKYFCTLKF